MERGLSLNQILFVGLLAWAGVRGWAPIWAIVSDFFSDESAAVANVTAPTKTKAIAER